MLNLQILMIPGMLCNASHLRNLRKSLQENGLNAKALSLPAHDINPEDPPLPTLSKMGLNSYTSFVLDQVQNNFNRHNIPVVLLGHSMGGLLTLKTIEAFAGKENTDILKAGIILGSAPPAGFFGFTWPNFFGFLSAPAALWGNPFKLPVEVYGKLFMNEQKPDLQETVGKSIVWESGKAFKQIAMPLFDSRKEAKINFKKIKKPLLILGAGKDLSTPARIQRRIAHRAKPSTYFEFPELDHYGLIDGPNLTKVVEQITLFLRKLN